MSKIFALIAAGGSGSRAGGNIPKQYRFVAGRPLIEHTLAAFSLVSRIESVVTIVSPNDQFFPLLCPHAKYVRVAGETRYATVLNGIDHLLSNSASLDDWVLVHDAARCLITAALINLLIDGCSAHAVGGILATPLADTLKSVNNSAIRRTINRSDKWVAQTPQMFKLGVLLDSLSDARSKQLNVTDESSAMELAGLMPTVIHSSTLNFKVTYPDDFILAESVLLSRQRHC